MPRALLIVCVAFSLLPACRRPVDPVAQRAANRQELFEALRPVKLSNCELERIGDRNDGGYLICKNLTTRAESIYSYGISATDNWGCTLSARLKRPVHQYDCFNLERPPCEGATPVFHEECVDGAKVSRDGRPFDTVAAHVERNGDRGKRLLMKMDVEGSEWESFLTMPDSLLRQIDQLSVEFHGVEERLYVEVMQKLGRIFHVVNVHYNNFTCHPDTSPLPATAYEVLFVNKSIGVVDRGAAAVIPNPLDTPNNPGIPDCQAGP
jgi:hypothetical protein